jgi:hypothetical protein
MSLVAAQAASAATEVGNTCSASAYAPNFTLFQIGRAPGTLPLTVPSAGVVTQWKVVSALSTLEREQLKVFRGTGNGNEFTVTAASEAQLAKTGLNVFSTRIPVAAGDRFGVAGNALYCSTGNALDVIGDSSSMTAPVGSTKVFETAASLQVAVSAVVEPDVDGDGFGDETQDQCPQSAALQTACPPISLDSQALTGKGSATVLLTASPAGTVGVTGKVKIGRGNFVSLKGGTKSVSPGAITSFTLRYPSALKAKLKELSPKQSLVLKINESAKNLAGIASKSSAKAKLPGQG